MQRTATPRQARVNRERPPPAGTDAIALLQSSSLPMLVQREIERRILGGEFPAGSKLNETAVADLLGVSRGPVREAFRALEESGLVQLSRNRGVFVRQIALDEADEIYELRAVLEGFIGRRVAQRVTPEIARELATRVDRMERTTARRDVDGYYQENLAFHDRLAQLAGNAKLLGVYRRLVNELNLFRHSTLAQFGTLPVSTREHREIVKRIVAGEAAAAGRALHDHVMASRERMHRSKAPAASAAPTRKNPSRKAR